MPPRLTPSSPMPRNKLLFLYSFLTCVVVILCAGVVQVSAQAVRKIAFTHGGTAVSHRIAVINEDGTGQVILSDGGRDRDASWSPDGQHIVFSGDRLGGTQIIRMKADGTGQVPLTSSIFPEVNSEPAWSPDGTKILFTSNRAELRRNEIASLTLQESREWIELWVRDVTCAHRVHRYILKILSKVGLVSNNVIEETRLPQTFR